MGLFDRRLLSELRRLDYAAVHTSERIAGREGDWLQPRFSILADDTLTSVERDALADPPLVRRAWRAAKSRSKRLR
jgi:hypothetical protein